MAHKKDRLHVVVDDQPAHIAGATKGRRSFPNRRTERRWPVTPEERPHKGSRRKPRGRRRLSTAWLGVAITIARIIATLLIELRCDTDDSSGHP
jgi:hypothetical protein